ncbi:MAG TPA: DUF5995 family protein [Granulicella sp.]
MAIAAQDQALYAIVNGTKPATIEEVIAIMQSIDALLVDEDGLKWFNRLYLMVTQQVDLNPPDGAWKDAEWLLSLDVIFAGLYLEALAGYLSGDPAVPSSWLALMEARYRPGIERIQFALAGMNAHINRDLAVALLKTNAQCHVTPVAGGPQRTDYDAVNGLLNTLMPATLTMLAADPWANWRKARASPDVCSRSGISVKRVTWRGPFRITCAASAASVWP